MCGFPNIIRRRADIAHSLRGLGQWNEAGDSVSVPYRDNLFTMKKSAKQNLVNGVVAAVASAIIILVIYAASKVAPSNPFEDSAFIEEVGNINRY